MTTKKELSTEMQSYRIYLLERALDTVGPYNKDSDLLKYLLNVRKVVESFDDIIKNSQETQIRF